MNASGVPAPHPPGDTKAPSAVDLLGDAFALIARRPDLFLPLLVLDVTIAVVATWNINGLVTPVASGVGVEWGSAGVVAGLLAPSLLPFGGLDGTSSGSATSSAAWGVSAAVARVGVVGVAALVGVWYLIRLAAVARPGRLLGAGRVTMFDVLRACGELIVLLVTIPLFVAGPFVAAGWAISEVEDSAWPLIAVTIALTSGAFFWLRFSFDALAMDRVSPLEAAARSWRVVSSRPAAALRLLALSVFIAAGTRTLWLSLIETPLGLVIGIVGNGLIATALALARMNFYCAVRGG